MAHIIRKVKTSLKPVVLAPVVETTAGQVQGKECISRDGRKFYEYLGIPYAKPPIGPLRFEAPQPWTEKWSGVRDATKDGAKAMQYDSMSKKLIGEEDCLFVNVCTPQLGATANLPVLFWIHGGSFILGSGNDYRPDYFMEHDAVIVSVNYRLGAFGFLSTGSDGLIRGNMGLKDQNMALHWVQENIEKFGGNRGNVTIAGESAGGASVHFHVLSKMSTGLFHKAISQSGMATLPFSIHKNPLRLVKRFATMLDCSCVDNTQEMITYLKNLDASLLASVVLGMFDNFRPTIEVELNDGRSIITQDPQTIIDSGIFNHVPYIVGLNSGEGILVAGPMCNNKPVGEQLAESWGTALANFMFFPDDVDPKILDPCKQIYFPDGFDPSDMKKYMANFRDLFSDWVWNVGFHNAVNGHVRASSSTAPLFIYYYDYIGQFSLGDLVTAIGGDFHPVVEVLRTKGKNWVKENILGKKLPNYGSCHGDGLSLQWSMPAMCYVPKRSPDYDISKHIVQNMLDFMVLDNTMHNPFIFFAGKKWKAQEKGLPLRYMHICANPHRIDEPFTDRLAFWQEIRAICDHQQYGWNMQGMK